MKLNIFKIPTTELPGLRKRLAEANAEVVHRSDQAGWSTEFHFSRKPPPYVPDWIKLYSDILPRDATDLTRTFFGTYLFIRGETAYAISYGKAHFYLRSFCDFDFGINIAKRIASEDDTNQTATRRFQGRRKKDIRSYTANTQFDTESGESVDLIEARIVAAYTDTFGYAGRFGTSALFVIDITRDKLPDLMNNIEIVETTPERFSIPPTTAFDDELEIKRLDKLLIEQLRSDVGTTDFSQNSFDLYGVDFIFSSTSARFELKGPYRRRQPLELLTMKELKEYITSRDISDDGILKIRVAFVSPDGSTREDRLKNIIDYIVEDENVALVGGKWMRFNQDYINYLDSYVGEIETEPVESQFITVVGTEGEFNDSDEIAAAGFISADKNFDVLKTATSTPVEAWDLQRENTVYAVKFGTAQKSHYVCDQAIAVLELLRNRANVKEIPDFERYCLWFGYRVAGDVPLSNISLSGSIILKQKIEMWARKCRELGITPVIRISRPPYKPRKKMTT